MNKFVIMLICLLLNLFFISLAESKAKLNITQLTILPGVGLGDYKLGDSIENIKKKVLSNYKNPLFYLKNNNLTVNTRDLVSICFLDFKNNKLSYIQWVESPKVLYLYKQNSFETNKTSIHEIKKIIPGCKIIDASDEEGPACTYECLSKGVSFNFIPNKRTSKNSDIYKDLKYYVLSEVYVFKQKSK